MLTFENVTKNYGNDTAVDALDMTIESGEITVLIGPSGCGKTTTLRMINRLIEPSSGHIYIDGVDIGKTDPVEHRRNIGYVIQQIALFPHMTIAENIALVPTLKKWSEQKKDERVDELLHFVGMPPETFKQRYPHELSGGQQQRIGVIRALAADPDIILMDEPFSALDPITRIALQEELIEMNSTLGKTIVFVTHDIDEALKLAGRIAVMKDGKIVQLDTPENLLRNPAHGFVEEFIGKDRLLRRPELIQVRDIMIAEPVTISPKRTLTQALERMRERKVDSLMVVEKEGRFVGVLTAGDVLDHFGRSMVVSEVVRTNVNRVPEDSNVSEVLAIMSTENVGYVPVVSDENILRGLITRSSLINVLGHGVTNGGGEA